MTPSPAEWSVRVELAASYRLFALLGMDDLIYTHLSARVPGTDRFLINPYGAGFDEVTASGLVAVDLEGRAVDGGAVNPAGFTIHSAVYAARPDAAAVFHLHSPAGNIVSALADGLLPLHQFNMQFFRRLAVHEYEGIALDHDERRRIARDLGGRWAMLLRNHGLLTLGRSVPEAFILMYYLEQSCRIQVGALSTGRPLVVPPPEVCERTARQYEADGPNLGRREWPALLRLLERRGADYAR